MLRHPALHRLSREHSPALTLARRLLMANDTASAAVAQRTLATWLPALLGHFRAEEQILLPRMRAAGLTDAVTRLLAEHHALREQFAAIRQSDIPADDSASLARWQQTGALLRAHVQFEERELFPQLEQRLDANAMAVIADALAAAEPALASSAKAV